MDFKKSFCCGFNFSNDDIISGYVNMYCCVLWPPPDLKTSVKNDIFGLKWGQEFENRAGHRGGGDSAYERGGDFRRKFWIKPRRPIWAWPKLFLTPKKRPCWNTDNTHIFYIFSRATLNETFTAKYDGVLLRTPLSETKIRNLHP